ncbi:MAG: flagellar basal body-associated FliL family protein, partial [Bdellovibrionales bacterium]|nr:flagellar basal body-associated FliL family protein [Bdellovibrionales bacterium]
KLLVILTGVNLVITLGVLGVVASSFSGSKTPQVSDIKVEDGAEGEAHAEGAAKNPDDEAAKAQAASRFGKMLALDQFTVNLATPGSAAPKFARVNISVHVPTTDSEQEIGLKMARVRNTIIDLFNSKRPQDLATTEGRNFLKDEIKKAINAFMVTGKVDGVFFTNFALSG